MAKEEKPLEYQHRVRETKGVAQRLDLGYLKRPALLLLLRKRLTWALVAGAALACVPLTLGVGGSKRVLSNGSLSQSHGVFEGRCEVCHAQAFGGIPDAACEKCHDGAAHPAKSIDTAKSNTTPACVQCHVEHRGKSRLAQVENGNCTSCHANLSAHASGVKLKDLEITAFRRGRHPEFSTAAFQDVRPLRLNHAAHMPLKPKNVRGMKLPMQCVDCHAIDHNSPTGNLVPVTFEANCRSCHARELEFDVYQILPPEKARSPHTKDVKTIREYIVDAYQNALLQDPGLLSRPLGTDFTAQPNREAWLERVTKVAMDYVFERKCVYCHQAESYAVIKKVTPIAGRFPDATPWLQRGEFSHRSHRAVECASCHAAARASTKTEDVLIPQMKSCLPCHGESRAGMDRCSECHLYHNRSLEKERDRRPTEQLISHVFPGPSFPGPRPPAPGPFFPGPPGDPQ